MPLIRHREQALICMGTVWAFSFSSWQAKWHIDPMDCISVLKFQLWMPSVVAPQCRLRPRIAGNEPSPRSLEVQNAEDDIVQNLPAELDPNDSTAPNLEVDEASDSPAVNPNKPNLLVRSCLREHALFPPCEWTCKIVCDINNVLDVHNVLMYIVSSSLP